MLAVLKDGPLEAPAIVKLNYADVTKLLHATAAQLVHSHLKKLFIEGRVGDHDGVWGIK